MNANLLLSTWLLSSSFILPCLAFQKVQWSSKRQQRSDSCLHFDFFGGGGGSNGISTIPKSSADRDKQAIKAIQAAIAKPKTPSFPLIECEFPPLEALNKLGDGSLRSANLVDDANIAFCKKLLRGLSPFPGLGSNTRILMSNGASSTMLSKAKQQLKGATIESLRDGIPEDLTPNDVCVVISPSSRQDYMAAQQIATQNVAKAVVIVNGFAKDQKSVKTDATFGYFQKPLTYNSQIVGYLVRSYPKDWATIDLYSKEVLRTFTDSEILYRNTNTPDLRESGRLVQKAVDERAIRSRKRG